MQHNSQQVGLRCPVKPVDVGANLVLLLGSSKKGYIGGNQYELFTQYCRCISHTAGRNRSLSLLRLGAFSLLDELVEYRFYITQTPFVAKVTAFRLYEAT